MPPKEKQPSPPTLSTTPAAKGSPARYRLTAPHQTEGGATWPKGMEIVATPQEIAQRGIKAQPVASDG